MPLVISDSSTLIHLAAIGRLALLKEFYGKITIPPAVGERSSRKVRAEPGCSRLKKRVKLDG